MFLKDAGFGDFSEKPKKQDIVRFLKRLDRYDKNLKKANMNSNEAFEALDKILIH